MIKGRIFIWYVCADSCAQIGKSQSTTGRAESSAVGGHFLAGRLFLLSFGFLFVVQEFFYFFQCSICYHSLLTNSPVAQPRPDAVEAGRRTIL